MPEVIISEEELRARCFEWQKVLKLQDWIISVFVFRERDFSDPGRAAEIIMQLPKRMATIRILDPLDYPSNLVELQDMELALVHELLHLHFLPLRENGDIEGLHHVMEEQAIEAISRGLVFLKRGGQ